MKVHFSLDSTEMKTDAMLMKIILQSLLTNAFVFRNPQHDGNVNIACHRKGDQFEIVVSDDGEGIDPLILPRIFEMFFRGSERSVGNGLGLYIARKAVEQLGGSLQVQTDSNLTSFTITLPVNL